MMRKQIFLMRHGRTLWNIEGKLQGRMNSPLLESSISITKNIALYLKENHLIEKVYCSPLQRCVDTTQIIDEILQIGYEQRDALMECDMGLCEGLSWQVAEEKFPDFFMLRNNDKWNTPWPNGESYEDVFCRAKDFFLQLCDDKNILIIGHEMFNKCFLGACLDWNSNEIMSFRQSNHELLIVHIDCKKFENIQFGQKGTLEK